MPRSRTVKTANPSLETFADLQERLGHVPADRIRLQPPPGLATERDVLAMERLPKKTFCELIDGVLVEKGTKIRDSYFAGRLSVWLMNHVYERRLGIVLGATMAFRWQPGQVRYPDVSFTSWERFPNRQLPDVDIAEFVPDLVAEMLSDRNTEAEMHRKVGEYLNAGISLVWIIDPDTKTAKIHTQTSGKRHIGATGFLVGGDVLPGLKLSLKSLLSNERRPSHRV